MFRANSQIQLQLVLKENARRGAQKGAAAWIVQGLKLEESKLGVAAKARGVQSTSPTADKLNLEEMRAKLLKDIEKFHKEARTFMTSNALSALLVLARDNSDLGAEWDTLEPNVSGCSDGGVDDGDEIPAVPECLQLLLPSTLGAASCKTHGLTALVETECELRIGQMNDTLHAVRVSIGYKSFLYRHRVRPATSQHKKLRSFDEVHLADEGILSNARKYETARSALLRLYDPSDPADSRELGRITARYQTLQRIDLRANTAIVESAV
ncbi:hypothetical protein L227DRAFT_608808 [Lentinus tigrinus ALCF2SS1-6]|uniref:Uncharacterized protein n=1 Tax=Lentinus tigrinus ALCF2SS1-6 TaxID=1328759 RepID=A0A5C2SQ56_9APHY|nr:hypothetical protein L227DRAFT_608808 [Lentinus tigrinus ALCF2SS1-6]